MNKVKGSLKALCTPMTHRCRVSRVHVHTSQPRVHAYTLQPRVHVHTSQPRVHVHTSQPRVHVQPTCLCMYTHYSLQP